MINYLHIQNVGIIEDVIIELYSGFNVLTGETGAGKSLIISALTAITGGKFAKEKITYDKDYSLIEANLTIDDNEYLVSRKISKTGKNICKLNGQLITLKELQIFTEKLIDIHGQRENNAILLKDVQRNLLDKYISKNEKDFENLKDEYILKYKEYVNLKRELENIEKNAENNLREIDMLNFQIAEIENANISVKDEIETASKYEQLINAEEIKESYEKYSYNLNEVLPSLKIALHEIENLSEFNEEFKEVKKVIESSYYDLEEAMYTTDKLGRGILEYKQSDLLKLEARIDMYNLLKQKYGNTVEKILEFNKEAKLKLDKIVNKDEIKKELKAKLNTLEENMKNLAEQIYKYRLEYASIISKEITEELLDLEMKSAKFNILVSKEKQYDIFGIDKILYNIKTNAGDVEKEISKIASGGEMSRIMLAIKKVLADVDNTNIMIFDEIDTGISGEVGFKVGKKMQQIGKNHQVLCVTHLPTIAALGDNNYYINKVNNNGRTKTNIKKLTEDETIKEIARITSGDITNEAILNAEELRKRR